MSFLPASVPYSPVRTPKNRRPLTREECRQVLRLSPEQKTGYTYAKSSSYSANCPDEYIHPNIGRRPSLSNSSSSDSSEDLFDTNSLTNNIASIWHKLGDMVSGNSLFDHIYSDEDKRVVHRYKEKKCGEKRALFSNLWLWLLGSLILLLVLLWVVVPPNGAKNPGDVISEAGNGIRFVYSYASSLLTSTLSKTVSFWNHSNSNDIDRIYQARLEEIVEEAVAKAIRKNNADKTGEPDFALESAGASILNTRSSVTYPSSRVEKWWIVPLYRSAYSSRTVIQRPSSNINAGECWAVEGSKAYLVIKLARTINVTAVSYEHLPLENSVTGDINGAPKSFKIWSLVSENDSDKVLIGQYVYDNQGEPLQRFVAQQHDPRGTPIVELEVTSNYGACFTCLYRLRVHGNVVG